MKVDRRTFVKTAAAFAVSPAILTVHSQAPNKGRLSEADLAVARDQLLEMVNSERERHGQTHLRLDTFGCLVADQHAGDMLTGRFLSHWGRDGYKPYHRYSFAGGIDAVQENVSSAEDLSSTLPLALRQTLTDMHQSMFDEVPPNDGHRRNILYPHHTHVGFGVAAADYRIRLDEIYIARYAEIDAITRAAKPGSQVLFKGKLLDSKYEVRGVSVYYEPFPQRPTIEWLRTRRSVGLPDKVMHLRPRLPGRYVYVDGTTGTLEVNGGKFSTPVTLFPDRGINTIVLWVRRKKTKEEFAATSVCIRCE